MCSCQSIPECYVMFSGVKLSMGLFVLFIIIATKYFHLINPNLSFLCVDDSSQIAKFITWYNVNAHWKKSKIYML